MEVGDRFQFGPFSLDARERVLLRDGRLVPLTPKALSTLLVLVRNMGHLVEKDVLMAEVWPDEVVEEGNLAQHIFTLRKALGESPQYIETVPRRGYRFLDTASEIKLSAKYYTENSEVYRAYLRGRYCWSKHTREGLERAIEYFLQAITLGPNFAPGYAGLVDCYLRLATNYLPPPEASPKTESSLLPGEIDETLPEVQAAIKIGCEWDQKIAEREYKRAVELKSEYPAVHQWHAAYLFSRNLYTRALMNTDLGLDSIAVEPLRLGSNGKLPRPQGPSLSLAEEVQILCVIARAQFNSGNFDAAFGVLKRWWTMGEWPKLDGLTSHSSADLLFTAGTLASAVASTKHVPRGQKHAEALFGGAIGIFEQLGAKRLSAEGRIKLGICYYHEGVFDLARTTLMAVLEGLSEEECELRSLSLISLAAFECHAGRLRNSITYLKKVQITELDARSAGQYHHELATNLSEGLSEQAIEHFKNALHQFYAIGNLRYAAMVENNYGNFLLKVGRLDEAEPHLLIARKLLDGIADNVLRPALDETLAQLYLATKRFELAEQAILRSIDTLQMRGEEAVLAEVLTTQGRILARQGRLREAKQVLDRSYAVAERCGDSECAARALMTKVEEMCDQLEDDERLELGSRLDRLLNDTQKASTLKRLGKCHELIANFAAGEVTNTLYKTDRR